MTSMPETAQHKTGAFVKLPDGDKQRMARLYEEVKGRLAEMSMIMARNLNMEISERTTLMLRPLGHESNTPSDQPVARDHVEVHCTQMPDGHFECGCYDYDAGTCGPC